MNELITVIINVYNGEKYIQKCINSVLSQTYQNLEVLIIDDGSTDNTNYICKKINDKRIRLITQKNHGLSYSRNAGIKNAKGKYIYFVDADDYIEKDTINYLYYLCKKYNTDISTCEVIKVKTARIQKKTNVEKTRTVSGYEMTKKVLLVEGCHGTIWNKLIKRELLLQFPFENRIINDVVVVYKLFLHTNYIAYSNLKKYYYVYHENSIVHKKSYEWGVDLYKATQERYHYINKEYPNCIENEANILIVLMFLYSFNNPKIDKYLKNNDYLKEYRKHFSYRILCLNINIREKIKFILFWFCPEMYRCIMKMYLNIKKIFI